MKNNLYILLLALSTVVGATTTNATPAASSVAIATVTNNGSFKYSTNPDVQFAQFQVLRDEALANCKKSVNPRPVTPTITKTHTSDKTPQTFNLSKVNTVHVDNTTGELTIETSVGKVVRLTGLDSDQMWAIVHIISQSRDKSTNH